MHFFSKRMFKMHFFTIHFQHVFFSHVFFRMCVKHVKTYGKMHCEKIHFGNVNKMWNSDKTCIPNHHFWSSNLCSYIGVASTAAVERHAICFRVFLIPIETSLLLQFYFCRWKHEIKKTVFCRLDIPSGSSYLVAFSPIK